MNEQDLHDDLRIIERAFSRTEYNESIDRATRNLSVDVLAKLPARRRFATWKVVAVLAPVATAVIVLVAPWTSNQPISQPSAPVAPVVIAASIPAVSAPQPQEIIAPVKPVRVSHRSALRTTTTISEERLLSDVYNEQVVSGLSESIQSSQPAMFELTSQDLRLLSTSVNNENSF